MKIAASSIEMESRHAMAFRNSEHETLRQWRDARKSEPAAANDAQAATRLRLSDEAQVLAAQMRNSVEATQRSNESDLIEAISDDPASSDPMLSLIRAMVEILSGEAIQTLSTRRLTGDAAAGASGGATPAALAGEQPAPAQPRNSAPARPDWGMEYNYRAIREEYERTDVSARGTILTADGARIDFQIDLSMERYYREETSVSLRAGNAVRKDPLVINFGGTAAQLSNQRFRFDLDIDGIAEEIPMLVGGSGYLALDLNGNGRVDDGRELFGPSNGSGFNELAQLDSDGNGWLDENDPAFGRLRVWQPDGSGSGRLDALADLGVGALYLGRIRSPFELRGSGNTDLGAVRETGLFLTETGKAGTMQEIDLTI